MGFQMMDLQPGPSLRQAQSKNFLSQWKILVHVSGNPMMIMSVHGRWKRWPPRPGWAQAYRDRATGTVTAASSAGNSTWSQAVPGPQAAAAKAAAAAAARRGTAAGRASTVSGSLGNSDYCCCCSSESASRSHRRCSWSRCSLGRCCRPHPRLARWFTINEWLMRIHIVVEQSVVLVALKQQASKQQQALKQQQPAFQCSGRTEQYWHVLNNTGIYWIMLNNTYNKL